MPNARFIVSIKETDLINIGIDDIEYFISTNLGEEAKPMAKANAIWRRKCPRINVVST